MKISDTFHPIHASPLVLYSHRTPLLGGSVSAPTVAFSSISVAAELLLLPTGRIWMWNFLGSSSSKSESLE